jgi:hypothetical protein
MILQKSFCSFGGTLFTTPHGNQTRFSVQTPGLADRISKPTYIEPGGRSATMPAAFSMVTRPLGGGHVERAFDPAAGGFFFADPKRLNFFKFPPVPFSAAQTYPREKLRPLD